MSLESMNLEGGSAAKMGMGGRALWTKSDHVRSAGCREMIFRVDVESLPLSLFVLRKVMGDVD